MINEREDQSCLNNAIPEDFTLHFQDNRSSILNKITNYMNSKLGRISSDYQIKLIEELKKLGYTANLEGKEGKLVVPSKGLSLSPQDLFFVDAAFENLNNGMLVFAINSPLYDVKGYLIIFLEAFTALTENGYKSNFELDIVQFKNEMPSTEIKRQYNMRKVGVKEFDKDRYELREGFPDFPPCPYGHTFKALGYDKKTSEYVRLSPKTLKNENVKLNKYQ